MHFVDKPAIGTVQNHKVEHQLTYDYRKISVSLIQA